LSALLQQGIGHEDNFNEPLYDAIARQDFEEVAQQYRIISQDTINVLVPYKREIFRQIRNIANNEGLSRQWLMKARPYSVSLFRPKVNDPLYLSLETIKNKLLIPVKV
jgi:hypothetical protein